MFQRRGVLEREALDIAEVAVTRLEGNLVGRRDDTGVQNRVSDVSRFFQQLQIPLVVRLEKRRLVRTGSVFTSIGRSSSSNNRGS